ncbi:MAG: presenilin family intramembrane aspartyl protease [Nanoarchaeota archaeon]
MKHTLLITITLALLFLASHFTGLIIIDKYLPKTLPSGEIVEKELPLNIERPQVEETTSYLPIFIIILISTAIALIFIKFQLFKLWKLWFFISIALTLTIAFNAFISQMAAIVLAIILALFKLFKQSTIINNLAEIFIYGGLAAIFVPLFNLTSISILLVLISIYDFYSVYKSKHMIKLAKFQTKAKVFTGLNIPYKIKTRGKKIEFTTAILGGGDIGFTLFFSGVILKEFSLLAALITSFVTTLALIVLLFSAKKGKFYPAMPILTLGCFLGYLIVKFII